MQYTINSIDHIPGTPQFRQGIKKSDFQKFKNNNKILGGSNGSYRTITHAETIVTICDENGRLHSVDVYHSLKDISNGRKFSDDFMDKIRSKIVDCNFEVNKGESVKETLNQVLKNALES